MDSGLKGKLVVITGGARGLGYASATKFAKEGAEIVLADINGEMAKESAAKLQQETGAACHGYQFDVSRVDEIKAFFAQMKETFGRVDVLVNNAGIQIRNDCLNFKEEDWDRLMDINLKGVFFCRQQAGLLMKETGGGIIVNMSSSTAVRTTPGRAPYCISKAGVKNLTMVLSCEFAKYNIRMNAVAPGWIMTNMLQDGFKLGIVSDKQLMAAIPYKRYADMSEIADVVVYLCSDQASYITGQCIHVDGGQTALGLPDIL
ncbi:MAG: short-chain dehydrogenase [Oscillospiraceae bacterium]|nr:MAG: short-chain dehydrogenase [Oscillospiraceae bacterium]